MGAGRRLTIALLLGIAGCGGGGAAPPATTPSLLSTTSTSSTQTTGAVSPPPATFDLAAVRRLAAGQGDDWTTFAHDTLRTAYQGQPVGFDATTVATLAPAWTYATGEPLKASPIVAGGAVYVATQRGSVVALDAATGAVRWRAALGGEIAMTPTLADGAVFVATHAPPATFAALDAATGSVRWSRTFPFALRSEPVVTGGEVVMGLAGGDPPACANGGVVALDEATGATRWTWTIAPDPGDGGSVWGPISWDGTRLYFGTGNTCLTNVFSADAVVGLAPSGTPAWNLTTVPSVADDDIGAGVLVLGGRAATTSKDGKLYVVDATAGTAVAAVALPAADGYGGIGSPSTDGTTLFVSAGSSSDPRAAGAHGTLLGLDSSLATRWSLTSNVAVPGYVAVGGGVGFVALDGRLRALDPATGSTLWSWTLSSTAYASPAVVPSGVYAADDAGDVYAFRPAAGHVVRSRGGRNSPKR